MPSLSVRCPRCQAVFKVDAALAGQSTHCAKCGQAMLVPSPAAPPIVNAPPVAAAPPAMPASPRLEVVAAEPTKPKPAAPVRRELTPKEKAKLAFRANVIMLAFGVIVLTATMLVLLYLTGDRPPS